jgi:hypothetical protein
MMVRCPIAVTEDDYWVSFPLEGLTADLLRLGFKMRTGFVLYRRGVDPVMDTVERERHSPCKYCTKRMPRRLFLILKPLEGHRLVGFVVCESCADQFKADVARTND